MPIAPNQHILSSTFTVNIDEIDEILSCLCEQVTVMDCHSCYFFSFAFEEDSNSDGLFLLRLLLFRVRGKLLRSKKTVAVMDCSCCFLSFVFGEDSNSDGLSLILLLLGRISHCIDGYITAPSDRSYQRPDYCDSQLF